MPWTNANRMTGTNLSKPSMSSTELHETKYHVSSSFS
jgi:hypothetical protein